MFQPPSPTLDNLMWLTFPNNLWNRVDLMRSLRRFARVRICTSHSCTHYQNSRLSVRGYAVKLLLYNNLTQRLLLPFGVTRPRLVLPTHVARRPSIPPPRLEQHTGFEPVPSAWKADMLPITPVLHKKGIVMQCPWPNCTPLVHPVCPTELHRASAPIPKECRRATFTGRGL